ncbi:MAG: hypothetical protein ACRERR_08300 [Moraxellaceae bacterium]
MDTSTSSMGWGFSCNDGWFDIIDILCANLQFWTDRNGAPQSVAKQVKEKLGTLHFYCSGGNELTFGMVVMAQSMSARICEVCGAPGLLKAESGWYQVRCAAHANQNQNGLDLEDSPAE